jgi:endogenous inhibitor of DNA gyrase (YacG/DUF329 family)
MSTSRVTLKCGRCGSTQFELPDHAPRPNDTIKCAGCGATDTWGHMQKTTLEQAKKQAEKAFKDAFKKWK